MNALLVSGSPSVPSRSAALLQVVAVRLEQAQVPVRRLSVRDVDAVALVTADFGHASVLQATQLVEEATVLVVATPVYKAAYSGVLKAWLDLLPQSALKGKTVLPLATGGSPHCWIH